MKAIKVSVSPEVMLGFIGNLGVIPKDSIIVDAEYHYNHIDIILESDEFGEVPEGCDAEAANIITKKQ